MAETKIPLLPNAEYAFERLDDLASILALGVLRLRARRVISATSKKARNSPTKDLISTPERSVHGGRNDG